MTDRRPNTAPDTPPKGDAPSTGKALGGGSFEDRLAVARAEREKVLAKRTAEPAQEAPNEPKDALSTGTLNDRLMNAQALHQARKAKRSANHAKRTIENDRNAARAMWSGLVPKQETRTKAAAGKLISRANRPGLDPLGISAAPAAVATGGKRNAAAVFVLIAAGVALVAIGVSGAGRKVLSSVFGGETVVVSNAALPVVTEPDVANTVAVETSGPDISEGPAQDIAVAAHGPSINPDAPLAGQSPALPATQDALGSTLPEVSASLPTPPMDLEVPIAGDRIAAPASPAPRQETSFESLAVATVLGANARLSTPSDLAQNLAARGDDPATVTGISGPPNDTQVSSGILEFTSLSTPASLPIRPSPLRNSLPTPGAQSLASDTLISLRAPELDTELTAAISGAATFGLPVDQSKVAALAKPSLGDFALPQLSGQKVSVSFTAVAPAFQTAALLTTDPIVLPGSVAAQPRIADQGATLAAPTVLAALPQVGAAPDPLPQEPVAPARAYTLSVYAPEGLAASITDPILVELEGFGFEIGNFRKVAISISGTNIRYYHAEDAEVATALAGVLGAPARDFTSFSPSPKPGTVELWLAGDAPRRATRSTGGSGSATQALRNRLVNSLRRGDHL